MGPGAHGCPQPYPMYPATTSLVNVVPKLNATGRDLLQVSVGGGGHSCVPWWGGGCSRGPQPRPHPVPSSEPAEVQPGAADIGGGGPAAPLLHGLLPPLSPHGAVGAAGGAGPGAPCPPPHPLFIRILTQRCPGLPACRVGAVLCPHCAGIAAGWGSGPHTPPALAAVEVPWSWPQGSPLSRPRCTWVRCVFVTDIKSFPSPPRTASFLCAAVGCSRCVPPQSHPCGAGLYWREAHVQQGVGTSSACRGAERRPRSPPPPGFCPRAGAAPQRTPPAGRGCGAAPLSRRTPPGCLQPSDEVAGAGRR